MVATMVVLLTSLSVLGFIIFMLERNRLVRACQTRRKRNCSRNVSSSIFPLSISALTSSIKQKLTRPHLRRSPPANKAKPISAPASHERSMEDPKPAPAPAPAPDPTAQTPPGQPPLPPPSKKRPLDADASVQNSKYFRMRAVLGDLRPHFIEVLRTPDFRTSEAAEEIRKQVKLLMDLYTQITGNSAPEVQPSTAENRNVSKAPDSKSKEHQEPKSSKPSDNKPFQSGSASEKQRPDDDGKLVGASAFGWNFVTLPGNEPVYYGMTKESFRAAQANVQAS